ncbi:8-oxoguanine glycosylase ogg1 [Scheffersomyces spartinae]|uniref:DNA-(apurinic or apyrimidinic site) lyase n=1 Tax=Scheffersomyces spartinae TaxID=45513 RepID=A0A9P8AGW9_9ASCO|nr:8-oxoguanine glycosylase ogg1 [Scheffersomyces spartinae]KAG7191517.1 8-oxoguanine glycosylase ogg1 [Scheffersomyces spartinae]
MSKSRTSCPFSLFPGIRILRQDPWETVVSFICSSNNNVKRISKMCDTLCTEFGDYIGEYKDIKYYSFPSPEQLSSSPGIELRLRLLGFGYRAKFIYQTALLFEDKSVPEITLERLHEMRQLDYKMAHEFLLQLMGVGPKVADCICLMSLDKHDVVPIDTHVYQIAVRDFKYKGKRDMKTLNKQMHEAIGTFYKEIFGEYAGWAQSVLFASDLSDLNNGVNVKTEPANDIKIIVKTESESKSVNKRRKRV